MEDSLVYRLTRALAEAPALYYRLVLLAGTPKTGKTRALREMAEDRGAPPLNLNLVLCEQLLELTRKQRALRVPGLLAKIVDRLESEVVILDNLEILFDPELAQDPLRLLQGLARNRTILAAWPGGYDGELLTYAEPGHPEARRYRSPEAMVVTAAGAAPGSTADRIGSESLK